MSIASSTFLPLPSRSDAPKRSRKKSVSSAKQTKPSVSAKSRRQKTLKNSVLTKNGPPLSTKNMPARLGAQFLISVVLIVARLACRGVYDSINQKREQELAAHQAELARLKDEEIAASHLAMGEVRMPNISMSEDARDVMKKLRDAGFINIVDQPKQDLVLGKNHAQYDIIEITVDGAPSFKTGDWYPLDTEIVVSYHTYIFE